MTFLLINKDTLLKMELSILKNLDGIDLCEFTGYPGREHYRLLACLSMGINNSVILDIGTHRGASARALAFNASNIVHSFDIVDNVVKENLGPGACPNITFHINDIFENINSYKDIVLGSSIIFLDIDPHDGYKEYEFYEWLKTNDYKGILLFDDINHFDGMRINLWNKISDEDKEDITYLGHWSGTGIIQFNRIFNFSPDT
jgi:hypothetical protein